MSRWWIVRAVALAAVAAAGVAAAVGMAYALLYWVFRSEPAPGGDEVRPPG